MTSIFWQLLLVAREVSLLFFFSVVWLNCIQKVMVKGNASSIYKGWSMWLLFIPGFWSIFITEQCYTESTLGKLLDLSKRSSFYLLWTYKCPVFYIIFLSTINVNYWTQNVKKPVNAGLVCTVGDISIRHFQYGGVCLHFTRASFNTVFGKSNFKITLIFSKMSLHFNYIV